MGRNFDSAPPEQARGSANSHAQLPDPIPLPDTGGMPELSGPTFEPLTLPEASGHAVTDLPEIPAADLPGIFDI